MTDNALTAASTVHTDLTDLPAERADLIESLRVHREFLRVTAAGLTDDQARQASTVSALTVGGLVKHVAATEKHWARFIVEGPAESPSIDWEAVDWANPPAEVVAHQEEMRMLPGESLETILAEYAEVGAATDALVVSLDSLDLTHPLPEAPWFAPGASRSARRTLLHIIAETAQHAGHADIIREAIDGQKTMG